MKKSAIFLFSIFLIFCKTLPAQEALKSVEEEYYDFLSLQGIVERPTLNYRTLSDSVWIFAEKAERDDYMNSAQSSENGENGEDLVAAESSVTAEKNGNAKIAQKVAHPWQNNNLGTTFTLVNTASPNTNWYLNGIKRGITARIYGPQWFNSFNTAAPYGQNDGALWQGRGYNTSLTAGARLEGYGLELTLKPQVSFSQNLEFEHLSGKYGSEYSYFYTEGGGVDLVQRFGDKPFWTFDWGDSEIRYNWHTFTVGFGTQSPWVGPAWLNPMLGSNNAASYPKFDIGLRKTKVTIPGINWYLGDIEGRLWTGYLVQSDYFNPQNYTNKENMLNALSLSFSPSFIPGFTIGVNRIFLTQWKTENLKYIGRLFTLSKSNDVDGDGEDQKVALNAYWIFPQIGFEVYGEFGIDDFTSNEKTNPFHTAIYTIGAKQIIKIPNTLYAFQLLIEWNNFEMSQDFQLQWKYKGYYSHGKILQGYTNKGQILGAGSGYFGNSQFVGVRFFYPKGLIMISFHRHCPDNNYIYNKAVDTIANSNSQFYYDNYANFKTYLTYSLETNYFVTKSLNLMGEFSYSKICKFNYNNYKNDINSFRIVFSCKYSF